MIFVRDDGVRLTDSELNRLRQANARNGLVVHHIRSREQLLEATIGGLDPSLQSDLLKFLETGPSR